MKMAGREPETNAPAGEEKKAEPARRGPPDFAKGETYSERLMAGEAIPSPAEQIAERDKQLVKKDQRVPLWLNVPVGLAHMAWAMFDGFTKYGIASWRKPEVKVTALSMIGAAERHLQLLKDGQDYAMDTPNGAHHAGHVMASMQIYLDCEASKKAGFDDRVKGPAPDSWPCKKPA